jgi:hypothetical protein
MGMLTLSASSSTELSAGERSRTASQLPVTKAKVDRSRLAPRLVAQGSRESEAGQGAVAEAGHGADPGTRKGEDQRPDIGGFEGPGEPFNQFLFGGGARRRGRFPLP